jgi:hypothetical protein
MHQCLPGVAFVTIVAGLTVLRRDPCLTVDRADSDMFIETFETVLKDHAA